MGRCPLCNGSKSVRGCPVCKGRPWWAVRTVRVPHWVWAATFVVAVVGAAGSIWLRLALAPVLCWAFWPWATAVAKFLVPDKEKP